MLIIIGVLSIDAIQCTQMVLHSTQQKLGPYNWHFILTIEIFKTMTCVLGVEPVFTRKICSKFCKTGSRCRCHDCCTLLNRSRRSKTAKAGKRTMRPHHTNGQLHRKRGPRPRSRLRQTRWPWKCRCPWPKNRVFKL